MNKISLPYHIVLDDIKPTTRSEIKTTCKCHFSMILDRFPRNLYVSVLASKESASSVIKFKCTKMTLNIEEQMNLKVQNLDDTMILVKISDYYSVSDDAQSCLISFTSEWECSSAVPEDYRIHSDINFV